MRKLLLLLTLTVTILTSCYSQQKVIAPYRICVNTAIPNFVPNYSYGCKEVLILGTKTKYTYVGVQNDWQNGEWKRSTVAVYQTGAVISSAELLELNASEIGDYWRTHAGDLLFRNTDSTWIEIVNAADKAKLDLISVSSAVNLDTLGSGNGGSGAYTVTETDVTQHEAAITITESQISDLNHTVDTDTQLTELQVDAFADNNGYLESEVDGSITNEIQQISLSGNILTLEDGGTVDLSAFLDDQTITDFSLTGTTLSITLEDGNTETVDIGSLGDNLGNHVATQDISLNYHTLKNIGASKYYNSANSLVGFFGADDRAFGGSSEDFGVLVYGDNSYHISSNSTRQLTVNSTGAIIQNNIPTTPNHLTSKNYVDYAIEQGKQWTEIGTDALGFLTGTTNSNVFLGKNFAVNETFSFGVKYLGSSSTFAHITPYGRATGGDFAITSTGNVGIGVAAPQEKLDVNGNVKVEGELFVVDETVGTAAAPNEFGMTFKGFAQTPRAGIFATDEISNFSRGNLLLKTQDNAGSLTEKVRVTHDGKVGFGDDNPKALLSFGTNYQAGVPTTLDELASSIALYDDGTGNAKYGFGVSSSSLNIVAGQTTAAINFYTGAANLAATFEADGDALIYGNVSAEDPILPNHVLTKQYFDANRQWTKNGTSIFYNSGNVGIGITAPTDKLDVVGNIKTSGELILNGSYVYGDGKKMLTYSDSWLRLNDVGDFSDGVYCGSSLLRTDGHLQIGPSGNKFRIDKMSGDLSIMNKLAFRGTDSWLRLNQTGQFGGVHIGVSGESRSIRTFFNDATTYNAATLGTSDKIVSGLDFNWYASKWRIGATRGAGADVDAFIFSKNGNDELIITDSGVEMTGEIEASNLPTYTTGDYTEVVHNTTTNKLEKVAKDKKSYILNIVGVSAAAMQPSTSWTNGYNDLVIPAHLEGYRIKSITYSANFNKAGQVATEFYDASTGVTTSGQFNAAWAGLADVYKTLTGSYPVSEGDRIRLQVKADTGVTGLDVARLNATIYFEEL